MSKFAKYIIYDNGLYDAVMIFDSPTEHAQVANAFQMDVLSAGFLMFDIQDGRTVASCFGKSESLKVESRPEIDSKIINRHLGL